MGFTKQYTFQYIASSFISQILFCHKTLKLWKHAKLGSFPSKVQKIHTAPVWHFFQLTERLSITIDGSPAARLHHFLRFFPRKRVSFFHNSSFKFKRNGLAFWDFCPYLLKTRRTSSFKYLYALHAYIRPSFSTFPLAGAVAKYSCPCGRDCKMSASVVRKIRIVCLFVFL